MPTFLKAMYTVRICVYLAPSQVKITHAAARPGLYNALKFSYIFLMHPYIDLPHKYCVALPLGETVFL